MSVRRFISLLPASNREKPPVWPCTDPAAREEPSLDSLVPDDPAKPYDMKDLIV
jgi:propionyl-CoA carboxylase beta chain